MMSLQGLQEVKCCLRTRMLAGSDLTSVDFVYPQETWFHLFPKPTRSFSVTKQHGTPSAQYQRVTSCEVQHSLAFQFSSFISSCYVRSPLLYHTLLKHSYILADRFHCKTSGVFLIAPADRNSYKHITTCNHRVTTVHRHQDA